MDKIALRYYMSEVSTALLKGRCNYPAPGVFHYSVSMLTFLSILKVLVPLAPYTLHLHNKLDSEK